MDKRLIAGIEAGIAFGVILIIMGMAYGTLYDRFILPMPDQQRVGLMNFVGMANLFLIVILYLLAGVVSAMWSRLSIGSATGSLMAGAIAGAVASLVQIALTLAAWIYQSLTAGFHIGNVEMTMITIAWPALIILGAIISAIGSRIYAQVKLKI